MKYGLPESSIIALKELFVRYSEIKQVILYGSRAMGNYKPGSDIDLTIKGQEVTYSQMLKLENEIDDLLLPQKIDISLMHHIDNYSLLEHISKVGVVFYEKDF